MKFTIPNIYRYALAFLLGTSPLCTPSLFAQSLPQNEVPPHHELSFQGNRLMSEVLSLSDRSTSNPYVLRYTYRLKNKHGLSLGAGGFFRNNEGDFNITLNNVSSFTLRLGYEYRVSFSRNFDMGLGWDVFMSDYFSKNQRHAFNPLSSSDSIVVGEKETRQNFGTGPRISFNYHFNQWLAIGSEVSYYYSFVQNHGVYGNQTTYRQNNNGVYEVVDYEKSTQESTGSSFSFSVPSAIYIIIKF